MLYAYINEDGTVEKVEDLRDDPQRVRKLSNGTPKVRPVIYDNPPITPWQEILSWTIEVLNDSVIYHGVVTDKGLAELKKERHSQVEEMLNRKREEGIEYGGDQFRMNNSDLLRMVLYTVSKGRKPGWKSKNGIPHNLNDQFVQAMAEGLLDLEEAAENHHQSIDGLTTARAAVEYNLEQGW